jgi:hypothetical protein
MNKECFIPADIEIPEIILARLALFIFSDVSYF